VTPPGRPAVGTALPPLDLPPVSRAALALFAGASGDHNPIHIDIDFARAAGHADVFAHGMLSMAYLGRLLTNWIPQQHIQSIKVRFSAITPVHSQPVCAGHVTSIEGNLVTITIGVTLPDGTITLTGEAVVEIGQREGNDNGQAQ
jgi:acyl dehydratase